jgi:bifunctional DNA-binding transcriptional regulator/antitoxin component of YhaV-PrlF toxin-antitoxin module
MKSIYVGILTLLAGHAHGDQLYVSDKLVISVYPEMESETGKIANLETGDAVEVIERRDRYIKVKLKDEREGWVRASYLTAQAPAIVRLRELQSAAVPPAPDNRKTELTKEVAALKSQNALLQAELAAQQTAVASVSATTAPPTPVTGETTPAPAATNALRNGWVLPLCVVIGGLLGFGFGYRTLSMKIRKKYGNLKVI